MERYHTIVKIERLRKELGQGEFDKAYDTVSRINIKKLKSMSDLSLAAEAFVHAGRYEKAKKLYLYIYEYTNSKRILSKLVHVSIKLKDAKAAEEYLKSYDLAAPEDFYRYIFRYNLYKLQGRSVDECIPVLVELKDKEYIDYWVYELAKQYHKAGEKEKCVNECSDIILWFGEGEYVEKAKALKAYYRRGMNNFPAGGDAEALAARLSSAVNEEFYNNNAGSRLSEEEMYQEEEMSEELPDEESYGESEQADISGWESEARQLFNQGLDEEENSQLLNQSLDEDENSLCMYEDAMKNEAGLIMDGSAMEHEEAQLINENAIEHEKDLFIDEKAAESQNGLVMGKISIEDESGLPINENNVELSEDELISAISRNIESAVDTLSKTISIPKSFEKKKISKKKKTVKKDEIHSTEIINNKTEVNDDYIENKKSDEELEGMAADRDKGAGNAFKTAGDNIEEEIFEYPVIDKEAYKLDAGLNSVLKDKNILLEEIFGHYFYAASARKQIVSSLNALSAGSGRAAGVVITDESDYACGRRLLAKKMAKALCRMEKVPSNKAAVIHADKINNMYLPQKKSQLMNCCLIVEDAQKLSEESILGINELYKECSENIIFILEGKKNGLNRKLKREPETDTMFSNRINIPEYNIKDWKQYIYELFKEQDYELSIKAEAELELKINNILAEGGDCFGKIAEYAEGCIKNSEKRSSGLLLGLGTGFKLDCAQLMVINSEDLI